MISSLFLRYPGELLKRLIELIAFCIPLVLVILVIVAVYKLGQRKGQTAIMSTLSSAWTHWVPSKVTNRIQVQIILVFAASALSFLIVTNVSDWVFGRVISRATIDYSNSMNQVDFDAQQMANQIQDPTARPYGANNQPVSVKAALQNQANGTHEQISIVDSKGQVLVSSSNVDETSVSLQRLIQQEAESTDNSSMNSPDYTPIDSIVRIYPVTYQGQSAYVVVKAIPVPNIVYTQTNNPLATALGLVAFILVSYWLTRRKMLYLRDLSHGLHEIAGGNLGFRVRKNGSDELASLADDINSTASALQTTIEAERLAERTKNELITNVSHDLRTPLTLIMGYLRILKDRQFQSDEEYAKYVSIANDKAEKLGGLIESLFEYTKLTNQGVRLTRQDVSLRELVSQLLEETVSVADDEGIHLARDITEDKLVVHVDPTQLTRVFENLLTNSIQHSKKPGDVYVRLYSQENEAVFEVSNVGDPISPEDVPRLFERFYRGDPSRSSSTGGSGLGLAIAKSIVELHGGDIRCEADGDRIRFIVRLPLA